MRMAEKLEWRAWYLLSPPYEAELYRLLTEVHAEPKQDKQSWHDQFHQNPAMPAIGENLTSRCLSSLAPRAVASLQLSDSRKMADLLEATMQRYQDHALIRELAIFLDMFHWFERYRTRPVPNPGPFYARFCR